MYMKTKEMRVESGNVIEKKGCYSLSIAYCRLSIEQVVWQLLPMSISNRKSAIGNSSNPGPSDDRVKPSPHEKKMKTSATEAGRNRGS
jgi:hypothetical protein